MSCGLPDFRTFIAYKMSIMRIVYMFLASLMSLDSTAQVASQPIIVDQFGYQIGLSNVAILSDPVIGYNAPVDYTPGPEIGLFSAASDQMLAVYNPFAWAGGAVHMGSGDRGWWLDFSDWTMEGSYYFKDLQEGNVSPIFEIEDEVYDEVFREAMRMFYYNRCGMAKEVPYAHPNWSDAESFVYPGQDTECRYVFDSTNVSLVKEMSGGWFDAGDYNKYVTFAYSAVHNLLKTYQENPTILSDDYQIPESGNGIPDLLDEVKYELDWLLKMNNADGSTHIKLGSTNFAVNADAPPSANKESRFYGPTCTSASLAIAGNFALAADIYQNLPGMQDYADTLEQRAIRAWDYVLPFIQNSNLEDNCDDGTLVAGDADVDVQGQLNMALQSAIHLYMLTGQSKYHDYIQSALADAPPMQTGFWGPYEIPLIDALLDYAHYSGGNTALQSQILDSFNEAITNNWNGFFGFNSDDLYRAFMPAWSYHWGSNQPKALYGILNMLAARSTQLPKDVFIQKAYDQLHYFHGVNPLGIVYLSNMYEVGGDVCANEIYHAWFYDGTDWDHAINSPYGPAPGFVPGGPNSSFTITNLQPPYGQPDQKSYLDFNDGWPLNSWEITEPAIYYQAAYIRLLAHFTRKGGTTLTDELTGSELIIAPNPVSDHLIIVDDFISNAKIFSASGQLITSWSEERNRTQVVELPEGEYVLFGYSKEKGKWVSQKFIKL